MSTYPAPAKSLLLVEDEAIVAMDIADQLISHGYRIVEIVDNGKDALRSAEKHCPDLVLMDVNIKGDMDGIDTAAAIMDQRHTPVLYLTAFTDPKTVQRAAATGPYGYLAKPFQVKELIASIEVALYKSMLEKRLQTSEKWFTTALRCVADAVLAVDKDGRLVFLNTAAEKVLGRSLEQVLNHPLESFLSFLDTPPSDWTNALQLAQPKMILGRTLITPDGHQVTVDLSSAPIRDEKGDVLGRVYSLKDVTPRAAAESMLRASEERFRAAFDFAPIGMALVTMDGRFIQGNKALQVLLKYIEVNLQELTVRSVTLPGEEDLLVEVLQGLLESNSPFVQIERRFRAVDGTTFWALVSASVLDNAEIPMCLLLQIHEVTDRKQSEQLMLQQAQTDALTGLFNKARFGDEIQRWAASSRRQNEQFAVVFMDLDNFKPINDTYGHTEGDLALVTVSQRLKKALRETDFLCRWGGDEFVALVRCNDKAADLTFICKKLQQEINSPLTLDRNVSASVTLSLGVSFFPTDSTDVDLLVKMADKALYRAKSDGKARFHFFK